MRHSTFALEHLSVVRTIQKIRHYECRTGNFISPAELQLRAIKNDHGGKNELEFGVNRKQQTTVQRSYYGSPLGYNYIHRY